MPNLARLMQMGTTTSLSSTVPPITAPAWTSFLTGCNPGKHGVYAFRGPMRGNWQRPVSNAKAIRAPRIWQFLELFGLSAGLLNVPMTYPVEPLNGYMVAGMLTPDRNKAVAYPDDVQHMLREQGYVVDLHIGRRELEPHTGEEVISLADALVATIQQRARTAVQLLTQRQTSFFAVVFVATDRIQHYAWQYIERLIQQPDIVQGDHVCQRVLAVYQEVDRAIGTLLANLDEQTAVIVISDHGFCGLHTRVHLNEWLAREGWLKFRQGAREARGRAKRWRGWLKRLLPRRVLLWGRKALAVTHTLEWAQTQAYTGDASENAVRINVAGREPEGTVEPGAPYQKVRAEIAAALAELRDPRNGLPIMRHVYERERIYNGPFLDLAPDIVFEPAEGYEITSEIAYRGHIFEDVHDEGRGIHAREGILIAAGAGIRSGSRGEAEIADVAPTVLYLLGLPVPAEMDGRVLEEILLSEWLEVRPPRREHLREHLPVLDDADNEVYTNKERRLLEQRLGDLGYLE